MKIAALVLLMMFAALVGYALRRDPSCPCGCQHDPTDCVRAPDCPCHDTAASL